MDRTPRCLRWGNATSSRELAASRPKWNSTTRPKMDTISKSEGKKDKKSRSLHRGRGVKRSPREQGGANDRKNILKED